MTLYSVLLIYLSVLTPIIYSLNYNNFISDIVCYALFYVYVFTSLEPVCSLPYIVKITLSVFTGKKILIYLLEHFLGSIESTDLFRENISCI
jgi:hypothetical protein